MRSMMLLALFTGFFLGCGTSETPQGTIELLDESAQQQFQMEVWGDNWFAFYLGDTLIKEDSVSITTERSFNSETFTFAAEYPLQLNIVAKDFKENDTGLEYIGSKRQQMGDGGIIAQVRDLNSGKIVAVTNKQWKALVVHKAPLDANCVKVNGPVAGEGPCGFERIPEPTGWKAPDFQDGPWIFASEHSESAVRPKDGYDDIHWDDSAQIIWGSDLEKDNTILLRFSVEHGQ